MSPFDQKQLCQHYTIRLTEGIKTDDLKYSSIWISNIQFNQKVNMLMKNIQKHMHHLLTEQL
jgi:hypothetical protein